MAAFTTMLLLGLAASGAFSAGSALAKKKAAAAQAANDAAATAPGPAPVTTPAVTTPPTPPASTTLSDSLDVGQAQTAAARQRKRASAGNTVLTGAPITTGGAPQAGTQPKTLLGY